MANVHKDFHGALSFGLLFLEEHYGPDGCAEFLRELADTVYKPLADKLRHEGLSALREHWETVFSLEGGGASCSYEGDALVLTVNQCPAIHHMKQHGYAVAPHFCEHTRIVNEAVCRAAGYSASVEFDQAAGRCVQRFWRAAS
ncbi:MAG TPA: hypothetical protein PLI09_23505 [Candidatus Hydrogenedentes bacterium]|nr:hypothetical protein [Candidatus Hydrogenedentota bacterium]